MMAKQNKAILFILFSLVLSLLFPSSYGHRGLLTRGSCDNDFGSSLTALPVPDATISWAFKHYFDCSQRAVWARFKNPEANFKFYVGAGVPPVQRMAQLRADAIIIGPGLPKLSAGEIDALPPAVRNDPIFSGVLANRTIGALLFKSPEDQSTCSHLGTVMQKHTKVVKGRCDFYEPYGRTHSWRVLDADNNVMPVDGAYYHVAVWLQQHQSGKVGIALGTWKENFRTPMKITTPSCTRDMKDFSEKTGSKLGCFPVVNCPTKVPISRTQCEARGVGAEKTCSAGKATKRYDAKMGCGGSTECPNAVQLWDNVNMRMHRGMAISFSGNAAVDFVRGMIPHHRGALEMCKVLVEKLSCMKVWDPIALDGLVHFCNHVRMEQNREINGLNVWLKAKGLAEKTTCVGSRVGTHDGHKATHNHGHRRRAGEQDGGHKMSDGCGHVSTPSAAAFIKANRAMHSAMSVRFSCDHSADFVRSMIPHHKGAVAMCEVLTTHVDAEADAYLVAFCANVTRIQRAEIAWMSNWLNARSISTVAPCGTCSGNKSFVEPDLPCEDTLPTSSFCHLLGGDFFCRCANIVDSCGKSYDVEGFGKMDVSAECRRTCGLCGNARDRPPLFPPQQNLCPKGHSFVADKVVADKEDKTHPHTQSISGGGKISVAAAAVMISIFL